MSNISEGVAAYIICLCLYLNTDCFLHSSMEEGRNAKKAAGAQGRGRGKYKSMLNDGVKLPRSVKMGPGGGGGRKNKVNSNTNNI